MSRVLFVIAIALVLAGLGSSVCGIANEQFKPTAIGLVLIFGSGVCATLYLGSRQRLRH